MTPQVVEYELIDPDPYTVVACWIAAAAFILQFADFVRSTPQQPSPISKSSQAMASLENLEREVEEIERLFDLISRTIERGSDEPDTQFFDAEFGVGKSSLKLETNRHDSFSRQLSELYAKLGAVSLWANHTIRNHPDAAASLGNALLADLQAASERLNGFMRTGSTNRQLLAESRHVLAVMRTALTGLITRGHN